MGTMSIDLDMQINWGGVALTRSEGAMNSEPLQPSQTAWRRDPIAAQRPVGGRAITHVNFGRSTVVQAPSPYTPII